MGKIVRTLRGKITLNSPHLTLCGAGRLPAGLMYTHTHTHGQVKAPKLLWQLGGARIMTSIMSPYSEGEQERELVRGKK